MYVHAVGQRTCGFEIFVQTMNYKTLSTKRLKVDTCYRFKQYQYHSVHV